MNLIVMVAKKMLKNKGLVFCMLVGLIVTVALISSIPMYTKGILQRSLIKDMEGFQKENDKFTGVFLVDTFVNTESIDSMIDELEEKDEDVLRNSDILGFFNKVYFSIKSLDQYMKTKVEKSMEMPAVASAFSFSTDRMHLEADYTDSVNVKKYASLESLSDLEEHINIIGGKSPSKVSAEGIYETLITEKALQELDLVLDEVYVLRDIRKKWGIAPIKVKPVGIFEAKNIDDPYWASLKPDMFQESFIIDEAVLVKEFFEKQPYLFCRARWSYAFDYRYLSIDKLDTVMAGYKSILKETAELTYKNTLNFDVPIVKFIIKEYLKKTYQLTRLFWVLNTPVIIMLYLLLFMISSLIVERELNEIALLFSRGAAISQIVFSYFVHGLILGGIALITGPLLGRCMTGVLGVTSGFLDFSQRKALEIPLTKNEYLYAVLSVVISILMIIIPAFIVSRTGIIEHKRKITRVSGKALWEKAMFDFVLIGVSIYGCYVFSQRQSIISNISVSSNDLTIDPLMFFIPSLFIIGVSLLVLRLYPIAVKIIYAAGKGLWSTTLYVTLIQVGRAFSGYHFVMLLLGMTVSVGIFSAVSARTINQNAEEKIYYSTGCDFVIEPLWESSNAYSEPSFLPFTQLDSVQHAAKVYVNSKSIVSSADKSIDNVRLMGIEPYDFGNVAWFRNGMLKYNINQYLNLLSSEPSACLISSSLSKKLDVSVGDYIMSEWMNTPQCNFVVYGIVDYWPSWNPRMNPEAGKEEPLLLVGNLGYIQDHMSLEPYAVWLKLKSGIRSEQLHEELKQKDIKIIRHTDTHSRIVELRNNTYHAAINGALSISFIISIIVCFIGFLIYWILAIKSRALQLGIFRAMGLLKRQIFFMLLQEQLLTSLVALFMGLVIGLLASRIFVPFFQLAFDSYSQIPPFRVVSYSEDRMKVYGITGIVMLIGFIILARLISKININQVIKLGED